MKKVKSFPNVWAFYCGDINQDSTVDALDFLALDPSIQNGDYGYITGDLDGNGVADAIDFLFLDTNIQGAISAVIPTP